MNTQENIHTQSMEGMEGMQSGVWNREHGSRSLEHGVCRAGYGIEGSEYGLWSMELHRILSMQGGVWNKG